jgi:hypothetical protein
MIKLKWTPFTNRNKVSGWLCRYKGLTIIRYQMVPHIVAINSIAYPCTEAMNFIKEL